MNYLGTNLISLTLAMISQLVDYLDWEGEGGGGGGGRERGREEVIGIASSHFYATMLLVWLATKLALSHVTFSSSHNYVCISTSRCSKFFGWLNELCLLTLWLLGILAMNI